jgi:transcription antitermination factor NusG
MNWFVAYAKTKNEFKALDFFKKIGVNAYVPSYIEKREWSDRVKKILVPAISGYVFFELNKLNYELVNSNPYLRNVLRRHGKAVTIRSEEIETLKEALNGYSVSQEIKTGDSVKILSGAFKNRLGFVDFIDTNNLSVLINSIKITLSLADTRLKAAV